MAVQLYEAIVVDGAPDPELPGHIKVTIPELYEDNEVPCLIPPMFPGWFAGGWQSVPSPTNPDDASAQVRVIVAHLGPLTFRWMGTSQVDEFITSVDPGTRAGARSGDGRHRMYLDNTVGAVINVASDANAASNSLIIGPDDRVLMQQSDGSFLDLRKTYAELSVAGGSARAKMNSSGTAEIIGSKIHLGGGVTPPLNAYILSLQFLADLSLVCADLVACGVAIPSMAPYVAANATAMITKISTSLASGAPYLSTRTFGD